MKPVSLTIVLLALSLPAAAEPARFSDIVIQSPTPKAYAPGSLRNPVLPGFYPDPAIERVGSDYYLVNSTFAYYPGIPVFHSTDLRTWRQIGNAIDRPDMLDFSGLATSRGVFAPDISHHGDTFYILNTCVDCRGNFVITAKDAKGPWSDPAWLAFEGIDPSLFWDDDGKAYIVNNGAPEGTPLYDGHRAIWIQRFDAKRQVMTGPRKVIVNGGVDLAKKPVWIEGPHIFKKDGWYYLTAAEGGTAEDHSQVILRSKKVMGPYVPWSGNPILTQRDLPAYRPNPITSAGHADIVQTQGGEWWATFLATRPYQDGLYNTGRETFLQPVTWLKDATGTWPVIVPKGEELVENASSSLPSAGPGPDRSKRAGYGNAMEWLQIRTPKTPFLTVRDDAQVELLPLPEAIGDVASHPAFTGLRQLQATTLFTTRLNWTPLNEGDRAGIVALQNDDFYIFYGVAKRDGKTVLEVTRRAGPADPRDGVVILSQPVDMPPEGLELTFGVENGRAGVGLNRKILIETIDATHLSTAKSGGFVGTLIGLYAYGGTR